METQDATEMLSVLEEEDGYENGKNILFLKKKKLCLPHFLFAHEQYGEGSYVEKNTLDHRGKETRWPTVSAATMVVSPSVLLASL